MKARVSIVAGALALLAGLSGCAGGNANAVRDDGSVDLTQVTLVVGDQRGGAQALLSAAGELDELDYAIEWTSFTSGPPMLEAVHGGSVDIGGVGNTPPLFAIDQSKAVKIVDAYDQGDSGDAIVIPEDSPITDVSELEGRRVAVAKGSSANYNLLAQLADADLTFDDIEPVYLQPAEALAAFTGGSVDAWAIWDPFTAQAELNAGAKILSDGAGLVNGLAFDVASDAALADPASRAAIDDYLTRLARARVWAGNNPEAWSETWASETGMPREVTDLAVSRRKHQPIPIDASVVESEQQMWDAFVDQGQLTRTDVELDEYFIDEFNDSVARGAEGAA